MQYNVSGTDCVSDDGSERYSFLTAEMAKLFAGILNRYRPPEATTTWVFQHSGNGTCNQTAFVQVINLNGREVFRCTNGYVERLDVPHLIWCWLRTTALVRGAKALWKGWA